MPNGLLGILAALFFFPAFGFGGDKVPHLETDLAEERREQTVFTATLTDEPIDRIASSVSVVNPEEIDTTKAITLKETLRRIPGLDITSQGGLGRETSIAIRGARAEDTLVMIDGMDINDPIAPARAFNFADLTTANIERVEVVRGPQSALHGSDALGGVINIITRRGEGSPRFSVLSEGGSHRTFREILRGSGALGKFDYSFSGTRIDSDGVSSNDDYENNAFSSRVGYELSQKGHLDFVFHSVDAKVHLDDWDFFNFETVDDPNFVQETNVQVYQLQYHHQVTDTWDTIFKVGYFESRRDERDFPDPRERNYFAKGWYDGSKIHLDWQHNWHLGHVDVITVGFEYEEEQGESRYSYRDETAWGTIQEAGHLSEESLDNTAYYVQNQLTLWNRMFFTASIRTDDHEAFDTETTYRIALAYIHRPTNSKLKGTWGTGFKAPTLYQLFTPPIPAFSFLGGNSALDPEKCESFDIGIEQSFWDDRLRINALYFNNEYDDLIVLRTAPATSSIRFANVGEAESEGWELGVCAHPLENFFISVSYTYISTEDATSGGNLLGRPKDKFSIVLDYDYREILRANLRMYYVGSRVDWRTFTGAAVKGDPYTRVDLALNYAANEYAEVFLKIENLFDEAYQELKGYDAAGISAFGGIKFSF